MVGTFLDLKHFIRSSGSPARAALHLIQFEEALTHPAGDDMVQQSYAFFCQSMLAAVYQPPEEATADMLGFINEARLAKSEYMAYVSAGWKTAYDEGWDAFSEKSLSHNPYTFHTLDYDWWKEGYHVHRSAFLDKHPPEVTANFPDLDTRLRAVERMVKEEKYDFVCVSTIFSMQQSLMAHMGLLAARIPECPPELRKKVQDFCHEESLVLNAINADVEATREEAALSYEVTVDFVREILNEWLKTLPNRKTFEHNDLLK